MTLTVAGVLLAAGAVLVALTGDQPHATATAERYALIVATPIAVGLYAWREGIHARFGRLLVLVGMAGALVALSSSSNEVLYSIGRIAGWWLEVGLIYLVLSFPSGRLTNRFDRGLVAAAVALVAALYMPTAPLSEAYQSPSQFATCEADCPGNAFMLLSSEPGFVDGVLIPLRELLATALLLVVVVRLADRVRRATRLMRRTLLPVLVFAMLRTLAVAVAIVLREAGAGDSAIDAATLVTALGLPAMCIGFLMGMLRWRIHRADCLIALSNGLRNGAGRAGDREVIAAALSDPTVELVFWREDEGGGWVDTDGEPATLPSGSSDRQATLIMDKGRPVAAVVHDAALSEQRAFVETVGSYAFVWDDNRRLAERVQDSLAELRASRSRILAAADNERRRIERDLHDGGQQRLVALRIRLELADELMAVDPARARTMLHRLGGDVDAALDELRSLAAGVFPAVLAARGLPDALRTAALQSPVPASIDVDGSDRYPSEVEIAAYFCCIESLQNVAKHAPEASVVRIALQRNGDLRFSVTDDGPGFAVDESSDGAGLMNMRDRIAAVGGTLRISSSDAGTKVTGTIPVDGSSTAGAASPG